MSQSEPTLKDNQTSRWRSASFGARESWKLKLSLLSVSRLIVIVVLGVGLGLFRHHVAQRYYTQGREAFVAERSQNWDRFYSHPQHIITSIVVNIVLAAVLFGIYELSVLGITRLFREAGADENRS